MAQTLKIQPDSDDSTRISRFVVPANQMESLSQNELHNFITENTKYFFDRLGISTDFLEKDPSVWNADNGYNDAKRLLSSIEVVNDYAERGVKLMEDYNNFGTKDEDGKQYLLQVVGDYRAKYSSHNKSLLAQTKFD